MSKSEAISGIERRLREAVEALPAGLRGHISRVEAECERLAVLHDVDVQRARLAALGHDLVRHKKGQELLDLAAAYGLAPDDAERESPILVHGPVAARMLDRDYALTDVEIIDAVDCHTTARPGMTVLDKVLFIADKIEPAKIESFPAYREVYDLARTSLDRAVLRYLDLNLEQSIRRHWLVPERSNRARSELLVAIRNAPTSATSAPIQTT